jgi:hypothetical protein
MKLPVIRGLIDRRILASYRIDASVAARLVPAPFRPQLIQGFAVAGICLIRLKQIRPWFFPWRWGIESENAAHRIAVEWTENGSVRQGVYIPRRDTSSRINTWVGGTVFPGVHHHAKFDVRETADNLSVTLQSDDGTTRVHVAGHPAFQLPVSSIFTSMEEVSAFFQRGSLGYSPTTRPGQWDGLELRCTRWDVQPLEIEQIESSFFDNPELFPSGSVTIDHALLMRGIEHEWHSRGELCGC